MKLNIADGNIVITQEGSYEIYGSSTENNIYIKSNATVLLNNLSINLISKYKGALIIDKLVKVELTLEGNNNLTSDENFAGIEIIGNSQILIKAANSTCNLNIVSGASSAGIGGGNSQNFEGEIIIEGGIINITSTRDGAGIGGGNGGNGGGHFTGKLHMYGGTINTTQGSGGGAGIGGGSFGSLIGEILIDGGNVNCLVGDYGLGAGIGGGYDGNLDGIVTINDGLIVATGGEGSAGIGGGIRTHSGGALNGNVIINGGNTSAYGGIYNTNEGGAGIGSGYGGSFSGDVDLNYGNITAYGPGNANDIGPGSNGENNGNVNLKVKSVSVTPDFVDLNIGESIKVESNVIIEADVNAKIPDYQKVLYTSNDPNIAIVDNNGVITAIGYGNTQILATSVVDSSKYGVCNININNNIIIIGEIDMLIQVDKNQLPYDELGNVVCYGNNPVISYSYLHRDIEKYSVYIKVPLCSNDIPAIAEYKDILVFLNVDYSIALYSGDGCQDNLAIYALSFNNLSTNIKFCVGVNEDIDINNYNVIIMPRYSVDTNYSNKYYLFNISGYIGIVKKQ